MESVVSEVDRLRALNQKLQEQYTDLLVQMARFTSETTDLRIRHDRLIRALTEMITSRDVYEFEQGGLTMLIERIKFLIVDDETIDQINIR